MNSISEAHSNKRIMDFECLGFKNIVLGLHRSIISPARNDISIAATLPIYPNIIKES